MVDDGQHLFLGDASDCFLKWRLGEGKRNWGVTEALLFLLLLVVLMCISFRLARRFGWVFNRTIVLSWVATWSTLSNEQFVRWGWCLVAGTMFVVFLPMIFMLFLALYFLAISDCHSVPGVFGSTALLLLGLAYALVSAHHWGWKPFLRITDASCCKCCQTSMFFTVIDHTLTFSLIILPIVVLAIFVIHGWEESYVVTFALMSSLIPAIKCVFVQVLTDAQNVLRVDDVGIMAVRKASMLARMQAYLGITALIVIEFLNLLVFVVVGTVWFDFFTMSFCIYVFIVDIGVISSVREAGLVNSGNLGRTKFLVLATASIPLLTRIGVFVCYIQDTERMVEPTVFMIGALMLGALASRSDFSASLHKRPLDYDAKRQEENDAFDQEVQKYDEISLLAHSIELTHNHACADFDAKPSFYQKILVANLQLHRLVEGNGAGSTGRSHVLFMLGCHACYCLVYSIYIHMSDDPDTDVPSVILGTIPFSWVVWLSLAMTVVTLGWIYVFQTTRVLFNLNPAIANLRYLPFKRIASKEHPEWRSKIDEMPDEVRRPIWTRVCQVPMTPEDNKVAKMKKADKDRVEWLVKERDEIHTVQICLFVVIGLVLLFLTLVMILHHTSDVFSVGVHNIGVTVVAGAFVLPLIVLFLLTWTECPHFGYDITGALNPFVQILSPFERIPVAAAYIKDLTSKKNNDFASNMKFDLKVRYQGTIKLIRLTNVLWLVCVIASASLSNIDRLIPWSFLLAAPFFFYSAVAFSRAKTFRSARLFPTNVIISLWVFCAAFNLVYIALPSSEFDSVFAGGMVDLRLLEVSCILGAVTCLWTYGLKKSLGFRDNWFLNWARVFGIIWGLLALLLVMLWLTPKVVAVYVCGIAYLALIFVLLLYHSRVIDNRQDNSKPEFIQAQVIHHVLALVLMVSSSLLFGYYLKELSSTSTQDTFDDVPVSALVISCFLLQLVLSTLTLSILLVEQRMVLRGHEVLPHITMRKDNSKVMFTNHKPVLLYFSFSICAITGFLFLAWPLNHSKQDSQLEIMTCIGIVMYLLGFVGFNVEHLYERCKFWFNSGTAIWFILSLIHI
eukprot:TRINITY_DN16649_c0_g1_i2.p1 TRINITY_DN16649_c0_g1~~TRINITY_DN16649_c0_g1_i2.p1  ORF type:complete len:1070 (+),score=220.23 TRINITY_DN16649_c0_g1_i2:34-3243(+)